MLNIEDILLYLLFGFVGHRLGIMAHDFFDYGQIFGKIKFNIAKKINKTTVDVFERESKHLRKSEAIEKAYYMYDEVCNSEGFYSFLLNLLNCKYCTTIWTSLFVAIIAITLYGFNPIALVLIPLIGYFLTEKI